MKRLIKQILVLAFIGGFAIDGIGAAGHPDATVVTPPLSVVGIWMWGSALGIALLWGFFVLMRAAGQSGAAVGQAIVARPPSPEVIYTRLTAELGRPATFQEVASVHQMISSQINHDAFLAAGAIGLTAYLSTHHDL